MNAKLVLHCAVVAAAALTASASAQQYPAKVIRLIVPFAPSGPNDILARLVGQKLTQQWGQSVVIENRGGAGGTIGLEHASRLPADGYAIAMGGSSNLAVAPSLYKKLSYDPQKDFSPIINVAHVPYALAVNPTVPARNVRELIAIANRKQDNLSYGSSGSGAMSHLAAELLRSMTRTNIVHVSYKGTGPALTDVIAGNIDMMLADLALIQPHAAAGKLRVLGVTGSKRVASAPNVPTIDESGLKGYSIEPWFGVVAPAGIPRNIVELLNRAIAAGLKAPDVVQRLRALGYEPIGGTPEQFSATITADIANYARIVKTAGITIEP